MGDLGWIGVWLLVIGVVAIILEAALAGIWSVRLARRAALLSQKLNTERGAIQADLERLRAALDETRTLWSPYRRLLGWLRHPIAIALMQSYARRRASAR